MVIYLVVCTYEVMDILVDRVSMMTELTVTITAEQQIAEYAFLAVFRLWRTAFGFGYERLAFSKWPRAIIGS